MICDRMTVRNHYPRHYRKFYHQIQMFSHHFPSTFLNVCFFMCLLCCTNEGTKPEHQAEEKTKFTSTTRTIISSSLTLESRAADPHTIRIPLKIYKNSGNHENISGFFFDKRTVTSNLKVKAKTTEQKINGDTKVMIPLFDEITSLDNRKNDDVRNSSNIRTTIHNRNHQKSYGVLGANVDAKPNNISSYLPPTSRASSTVGKTIETTVRPKTVQQNPLSTISITNKVYMASLYPPLPAMVQVSRESVEEKARAPKSSIAKFLLEPELGQSWYNKNGPTPTFHDGQTNGTTYEALLGSDVFLDCQVTALEKDLVSWLRVESSSGSGFSLPVLLTVGFRPPHASENRFMLDFLPPHNYRLRIDNVQWRDEGRYICQLAVHPPSLIWSRLRIIRPLVHLLDSDMKPVADLHYDVGTTIEMVCRVKRPPRFHVSVQWEVERLHRFGLFDKKLMKL